MTTVQRLATAARPLAEVLVDRLRAANRPSPLDRLRRRHDDDDGSCDGGGAAQAGLPLGEDEEYAGRYEPPLRPLQPDEVAAAVLLGRALDQNRDVLRRLQDPATIAVIEVPSPDFVDPVERVLRDIVLGANVRVIDGDRCKPGDEATAPGSVILFTRNDDIDKRALTGGNAAFGAAVQRQGAIIGIAADPDRMLPSDLVRLAEDRIALLPLGPEGVAAVIEAITGRKPPPVGEEFGQAVTLGALVAGVRADLGGAGSLKRLHRLVGCDRSTRSVPSLADLHGLGAARAWGESLVADLRDYQAGRLAWEGGVDSGALISGPPGTGKTTFAKTLAATARVHFIATSYSEWQSNGEGHLGHVTKAIRKVFAEARRRQPTIVFIDELDTLPARGSTTRRDDWWTSITNCLLEELDGFERREGVVVIAACNDPSRLDPALVRAGRLDRHIAIPLPDHPALIGIFRTHLGGDLQDADLRAVALAARGRTGADAERYVRDARRAARKAGRPLTLQDLLDAVRGGAPDWPDDVRRRIAHHEAGHAIAKLTLGTGEPTALSINGGGGLSEASLAEFRALTREYLERHLTTLLAGRAAEVLVFGAATAGAGGGEDSDLGKATCLALQLESAYGLGHNGPLWLGEATNPRDLLLMPEMRAAVRRSIEAAEIAAIELLTRNRAALDALAQVLFANGYLDRAEIDAALAKAPLTPTWPAHGPQAQAVAPSYGSTKGTSAATRSSQGPDADTTPHRLT